MSAISFNLKFLRKQKGFTQEKLASRVGIKRSLVGAYEEGRAEPNIKNLLKFSEVLDVPVNVLIDKRLDGNEEGSKADLKGDNLRVLSITLDNQDQENIHLVPQKASAGYLNGYSNPEYVAELPVFNVPFLRAGSYRAFEITGDSMLPLPSGTVVVGKYIEDWTSIKDYSPCVIVTLSEGLVFKRVKKLLKKENALQLISDNSVYKPYLVKAEDVLEIWEGKGFFSTQFPQPDI